MTADEAYELICQYTGKKQKTAIAYEYKDLYGFRKRPGEMLCVIKKTGIVIWEDELPDDMIIEGIPKMHFIVT